MNVPDLLLLVDCYVGLRRAIGYTVRYEEKLLKDFVQFLASQNVSGPIRAQRAIDWACAPAPGRGPTGQASRLKVVRGFLSYLRATLPETEVPGPGVLAPIRRPSPYLYSLDEIETLICETLRLGPKDSLRPQVFGTLIGLLASSGLRVGEALRLNMEDVRLEMPRHPTCTSSRGSFESPVSYPYMPQRLRNWPHMPRRESVCAAMACPMLSSFPKRVGISPTTPRCGSVMRVFKPRMDTSRRICRQKSRCSQRWPQPGRAPSDSKLMMHYCTSCQRSDNGDHPSMRSPPKARSPGLLNITAKPRLGT